MQPLDHRVRRALRHEEGEPGRGFELAEALLEGALQIGSIGSRSRVNTAIALTRLLWICGTMVPDSVQK